MDFHCFCSCAVSLFLPFRSVCACTAGMVDPRTFLPRCQNPQHQKGSWRLCKAGGKKKKSVRDSCKSLCACSKNKGKCIWRYSQKKKKLKYFKNYFCSQKSNVEHIHLIPRAGNMTISTSDVYNAVVYGVNNRWKESENAVILVKYSAVLSGKHSNFAQAKYGSDCSQCAQFKSYSTSLKVCKIINYREKYV